MKSSTLQCAYSQCEERFPPKALAPRKRFHSNRCRTKARTERLVKQGQVDILEQLESDCDKYRMSDYQYINHILKTLKRLKNEL